MRFAFFYPFNHLLFKSNNFIERYNISPLSRAFVINDEFKSEYALWGFTNDKTENYKSVPYHCRLETMLEKYYFHQSFKKQRLIIPINGFYEWKGIARKKPYFIKCKEIVYLAALGSVFLEKFLSFALITYVSENGKSRPIVLNEIESRSYLKYDNSINFLNEIKGSKALHELALAYFINDSNLDDPSCLTPAVHLDI